jgi:NADPH:quinone reductase-like Zn-dependent oxidoreductase
MSTTQKRTAICIVSSGIAEIQSNVTFPRSRSDYVIAKTKAFALNAADNHQIDVLGGSGSIVGCDWSGVVLEVGDNVTEFKPGDYVYGICHGGT